MIDVIIIGAGPGGSAAAYDLLCKNYSVLVLDKHRFPRKKACAGGLTPKAVNLYAYDITPVIQKVCRTVKVSPSNGNSFLIKEKDNDSLCYMTQREELDFFSLNKIRKKGAGFQVIQKIESIRESKDHVEVLADGLTFQCRYLIGADGANSRVRKLTCRNDSVFKYHALEADVPFPNASEFEMEFDFLDHKKGYFWIFPKRDHVNIGFYSVAGRSHLNRKSLQSYARKKLGVSNLENIKGYPLGMGGWKVQSGNRRVFLVGDAAGFAESLLGEGIYFAIRSGQEAARAIYDSNRSGMNAKALYLNYLSDVRIDLRICHWNRTWFYRFPSFSLKLLRMQWLHRYFAKGFAKGKSISEILKIPFGKNRLTKNERSC